ncbi:MAG: ABC transporter ATP-binding protein [Clostridiales bacterium]|nr:ABC transporter ATP-binding protein [Clostridiales bacterium]
MYAIETKNLTKDYKSLRAVDNLNLKINQGEIFGLLGVNGAGKSTTIKMLSCLSIPTSGDAFLMGNSVVSQTNEVKKIINISPQETAVASNLTITENLELMSGVYGNSKVQAKKHARDIVTQFHMEEIAGNKARTLSGGWQRRLSIAMALISEPKILFLDEPTLGLDVIARRQLWQVIRDLKGKITIILTTHYMDEAESLSDRIGIMSRGKLRAVGTADEIIHMSGEADFESAFVKEAE